MEIIETLREDDGSKSAAQHFVVAAVARHASNAGIYVPLQVEFRINGVDIPFCETLEDIYVRFEKQAEETVAERANMVALLSTEEGLKQEARKMAAEMCKSMADKFQWEED
jgi:hypothetical protein